MTFQDPHRQNPFPQSSASNMPQDLPPTSAPQRGGGATWVLVFVLPLVFVLGGYGLLHVFFGVDGEEPANDTAAVLTSSVPPAPQTTPSSASPVQPSSTTTAPSPEPADPTPVAPVAEQITPGNYEIELAGGSNVHCQMYNPALGMLLACQTGNVSWTDDTGRSVNSVSIQFGPARAQGVLGDLGGITMEGTLSTGGVYEMTTTDGMIRIDTSDPGRIVFTRDGEEAWISRSGFGPVASPLDQLR